jgi:hypothetical protein
MEISGQPYDLCRFTLGEDPPHIGWVGPRAGLDAVEERNISCPCRETNTGCSASSPSLYRESYPGSGVVSRFLNNAATVDCFACLVISQSTRKVCVSEFPKWSCWFEFAEGFLSVRTFDRATYSGVWMTKLTVYFSDSSVAWNVHSARV